MIIAYETNFATHLGHTLSHIQKLRNIISSIITNNSFPINSFSEKPSIITIFSGLKVIIFSMRFRFLYWWRWMEIFFLHKKFPALIEASSGAPILFFFSLFELQKELWQPLTMIHPFTELGNEEIWFFFSMLWRINPTFVTEWDEIWSIS